MCRLLAISCRDFVFPEKALYGLQVMQDSDEDSGLGLLLRDLGGPFENMKSVPILSGVFSKEGVKRLGCFMLNKGFTTKYKIGFKSSLKPPKGVPRRDIYLVSAYDYPSDWEGIPDWQRRQRLVSIRMELSKIGKESQEIIPFSFWPDTIIVKELGNPMAVAEYLNLNRKEMTARIIIVQGEQGAGCGNRLRSCSPSFLGGFATVVNGENTANATNREFLKSRGFIGYDGTRSAGDVFTDTLHYTMSGLGLGLDAYKHIITPLPNEFLETHPQRQFLQHVKQSCRNRIIDGPNCIIGVLPDNTLFMVQDRQKLRPGVVGCDNGAFVFSTDISGLDAVLPKRDLRTDIQPMHMDIVCVGPERDRISVIRQTDPLLLPNCRHSPKLQFLPAIKHPKHTSCRIGFVAYLYLKEKKTRNKQQIPGGEIWKETQKNILKQKTPKATQFSAL